MPSTAHQEQLLTVIVQKISVNLTILNGCSLGMNYRQLFSSGNINSPDDERECYIKRSVQRQRPRTHTGNFVIAVQHCGMLLELEGEISHVDIPSS